MCIEYCLALNCIVCNLGKVNENVFYNPYNICIINNIYGVNNVLFNYVKFYKTNKNITIKFTVFLCLP